MSVRDTQVEAQGFPTDVTGSPPKLYVVLLSLAGDPVPRRESLLGTGLESSSRFTGLMEGTRARSHETGVDDLSHRVVSDNDGRLPLTRNGGQKIEFMSACLEKMGNP